MCVSVCTCMRVCGRLCSNMPQSWPGCGYKQSVMIKMLKTKTESKTTLKKSIQPISIPVKSDHELHTDMANKANDDPAVMVYTTFHVSLSIQTHETWYSLWNALPAGGDTFVMSGGASAVSEFLLATFCSPSWIHNESSTWEKRWIMLWNAQWNKAPCVNAVIVLWTLSSRHPCHDTTFEVAGHQNTIVYLS